MALVSASVSVPALAQSRGTAADRLSSYLRELAGNPNSLSALIGAGQAALGVGDGNAALGFFARADEQAPRNGQVKAGLARALLMVDNPRDALRMFDAAVGLGIPEAEIAGDRGLAFDLRGDQKRAQRDYALALSRGPNDEITRRYALSLGISGDRETALRLIDPLLYKRDQAAWRARAFVLAMTGDQAGAGQIVRQVMPERMAQAMVPFLQRLPTLRAAEKAAAVHLGEMPSDGVRSAAAAPVDDGPPPPPVRIAEPVETRPPVTRQPTPREARRRSGATASGVPTQTAQVTPAPAPSSAPTSLPPEQRGDLAAIMQDIRSAAATPSRRGATAPTDRTTRLAQAAPAATRGAPKPTEPAPAKGVKARPETVDTADADKPDSPKKPSAAQAKKKGAPADPKKTPEVADGKKKPDATDGKKKPELADAKKKPDPKGKKAKEEAKAPPRIWVQLASGSNAAAMPKEWKRVQSKAPGALKGRAPSTAPGRLLVGPFKSDAEAQAFVGKLRKEGVSSFQWDSPAGAKVGKLGGK